MTFEHMVCIRKHVRFKASVHPAQQRTGEEECRKRQRCYFQASSNPHGRGTLGGVRTSFDVRDSGKNDDLTNNSPTALST